MSDTYASFVLNTTAAMELRSKGTTMANKLHFVSNVVLGPPDFVSSCTTPLWLANPKQGTSIIEVNSNSAKILLTSERVDYCTLCVSFIEFVAVRLMFRWSQSSPHGRSSCVAPSSMARA